MLGSSQRATVWLCVVSHTLRASGCSWKHAWAVTHLCLAIQACIYSVPLLVIPESTNPTDADTTFLLVMSGMN